MAIKRIVGTAVRHPIATTGMVFGVAKGTLGVVRRVVRGQGPWASVTDEPPVSEQPPTAAPTTAPATEREPEVVLPDPADRDLPEPVVIEALDDEPTPAPDPEGHVEVEEELVWTSESTAPPAAE